MPEHRKGLVDPRDGSLTTSSKNSYGINTELNKFKCKNTYQDNLREMN